MAFEHQAESGAAEKDSPHPQERHMSPELGQVPRPEAGDVAAKRKAYVALLVPPSPGAPEGFDELFLAYWKSLDKHISGLEAKAGPVKRVLVEGVPRGGQAGLTMLERSNPAAAAIVATRLRSGAVFEALEDDALFAEVLDWGRCLQMGFVSRKVADIVQTHFKNANAERQKHLQSRLDSAVRPGEAVLLLTTRNESIAAPAGMERFLISPPELDELERWVRQVNEAILRAAEEEEARMAAEEQQAQGGAPGAGPLPPGAAAPHRHGPAQPPPAAPPQKPGGLWTPGQR